METENWLDTDEKVAWYFRKKTFWEKLREFFYREETVDEHFGLK